MSLLSFQRGYLAEPLSEEEQTKINTYLTICKNTFAIFDTNSIHIPHVCTFLCSMFRYAGMPAKYIVCSLANGGNVQNTWWIGGIDLHQEVIQYRNLQNQILNKIHQISFLDKPYCDYPTSHPGCLDMDVWCALVL